jgi:hypothetical protein
MKNKISLNEIKRLVRQVLNEREQEIDEEEMNMRIHFGIKEMRDDLTVKWLTNHPEWGWLAYPDNSYLDAVIGWNYEDDRPIWYSGTWEEGIWGYGMWEDGTFEGETWKDGFFKGGTFNGGTWENGNFYGGTFAGKTWGYGGFHGDTFAGETWENGEFHGDTFAGETWENGDFYGGTFISGTWKNGYWHNGTWEGGTWIKGKIWDEELDYYVESDVNPNEYFKNKKR